MTTETSQQPFCDDCFKGYRLPGEPRGEMTDFGGMKAYCTSPQSSKGPAVEGRVIVYGTDIFGLGLVNSKLLADKFADNCKATVWVPDYFDGEYVDSSKLPQHDTPSPPNQSIVTKATNMAKLAGFIIQSVGPTFLYRHREGVVQPRIQKFVQALREEKGAKRVGYVGYCFGGTHGVKIATTALCDAVAIAHPGATAISDYSLIQVPITFACAEEDSFFPEDFRAKAKEALDNREAGKETEWKLYQGTTHGFGPRPNLGIPVVKKAHEDAMDQFCSWFNKLL